MHQSSRLTRRTMIALAGAAPALIATRPAHSAGKVLKVVLAVDMRGIDPVFNTAAYAAYHGYLVYDQLFALDSRGKPQPQMVDSWQVSDNRKAWMFRLRSGLKFHDGSPVRAADAVASILRWKDRDVVGKALFSAGAKLEVVDDLTFTLALRDPFGLVLEALSKPTANALFVMPEAVARTPATAQISSAVGSGPFIFVKEEWRPGSKAVYVRNPDYVPRKEKPDGLAGGKVAKVDRIEWLSMPDPTTAISALTAGEIDYLQNPAMDTYPVLKANPKVRFVTVDPTGSMVWIRPNHLQPPFDNPKARQALLHAIDQTAILQAIGAPAENARPFCGSFFMCGTPMETSAGTAGLEKPDLEKAKALLKESGYDGRPVIFMQPSDLSANFNATVVVAEGDAQGGLQGRHPAAGLGNAVAAPQQQGPGRRHTRAAGTCSSPSPRRSMPRRRSPIPTSPPRAPTTSRASPATRSSSACAAAGGRAPTKPNARGSPTRSRCGRIRSCRTSTAGSGSSTRRCGRMSRGWGRRRCRCSGRW